MAHDLLLHIPTWQNSNDEMSLSCTNTAATKIAPTNLIFSYGYSTWIFTKTYIVINEQSVHRTMMSLNTKISIFHLLIVFLSMVFLNANSVHRGQK